MVPTALKAFFTRAARAEASRAPLEGERRETVQRLQVGFFGLGAMILLVGLANIIMNSVQQSRATAVPEAAPTVVASPTEPASRDPLADAGVVPDLPADPIDPSALPAVSGPNAASSAPAASGTAAPQP